MLRLEVKFRNLYYNIIFPNILYFLRNISMIRKWDKEINSIWYKDIWKYLWGNNNWQYLKTSTVDNRWSRQSKYPLYILYGVFIYFIIHHFTPPWFVPALLVRSLLFLRERILVIMFFVKQQLFLNKKIHIYNFENFNPIVFG